MEAPADADSGRPEVVVGIVADPDTPAELAEELAEELPELLAENVDRNLVWNLQVVRDPLTAAVRDDIGALNLARDQKARENWDIAICLTDLPLLTDGRPVAVDVDAEDRVALVSLPALGGLFLRRRVRRAIVQLVKNLVNAGAIDFRAREGRAPVGPIVPERTAPLKRAATDEEIVDLRIVGSPARGRVRLLLGMVRANGPWRLIPALAKALAAALATSAIAIMNGAIWNVSSAIGADRLAVVTIFSMAAMVIWLIVHRHLWERPDSPTRQDREKAALYNASTVLTLSLGVLWGLIGLCIVDFAVALFLIEGGVLSKQVGHSVGLDEYARLAWLASAAAIVGGALGSEFESDDAVRRATYGKRERLRREQRERERQAREREESDTSASL
ncbi:hypothetical protein [Streptomyces sp. NPDC005336]|uniref:hypothetical protein n=1 Tax=Streptomyces sp. NPDC005336 TaxID=3157035 RepID=UPI0033A92CAC